MEWHVLRWGLASQAVHPVHLFFSSLRFDFRAIVKKYKKKNNDVSRFFFLQWNKEGVGTPAQLMHLDVY
jgi:hypothetical protein